MADAMEDKRDYVLSNEPIIDPMTGQFLGFLEVPFALILPPRAQYTPVTEKDVLIYYEPKKSG
jgi:hypothetical protein